MSPKRTLTLQSILLAGCSVLLVQFALNFPFPAPIVQPFLGPKQRWMEEQIKGWARSGEFPEDYWAYFTRDPERTPPPGDNLVAPADGLLRYHDFKDGKQYVVIALSFWDVHVQRFPCDGIVTRVEDHGDQNMDGEGKDLIYLREKVCPRQKIVTMDTKWGELKIRLITSLSATRLKVFVAGGVKVKKGQRLGHILAGSTVVLEMPDTIPIVPKLEDRVVAGETILSGR